MRQEERMTPEEIEEIAARVLSLVPAGGQAEVDVSHESEALTRFANSYIHQNMALDEATTVSLRLHRDGRTAAGASNLTTASALADLVQRVVEAVRLAPADPGWPGPTPPAPRYAAGGFDEATAMAAPADRADRVRDFVAAAGGTSAAGYCRTSSWTGAFANSAGQSVTGHTTEATLYGTTLLTGGVEGAARQTSVRVSDLDAPALGARAAAKARAGVDPVQLPPGRYEVVLEPPAVADLLLHLAMSGFNGKAHAERRSFVVLGEAQLDASVTLVDDPFADGSPGFAYDHEGTPKRPLVLVDGGVSTAVAHDRRSAAQAGEGAASTGHAIAGGAAFGPVPLNLGLLPGPGMPGTTGTTGTGAAFVDPAAAPLVAGVDRGLLITDLHYTRVLDPRTLVVTGLTRYGVWLIENGEVTSPVANLRHTQSYPDALGPGAVADIGPAAPILPNTWGTSWWRAPALRLTSWNITGNASG
jgi:predicted Zn-dependent protease